MGRIKYSEFADRIDVEALCADIGFAPEYEDNRGNLVGFCLFPDNHSNGDTTGKFAIHPEKKVYNCFVCGGGDLLSLVVELNDWDTDTAEDYLRQFALGDKRQDTDFVNDFLGAFAKDAEKRVETMPYFNARVLDKWEPAYGYGDSVGLINDVIDQFFVKYNPEHKKPSPIKGKFAEDPDYVGPAVIWPHFWNGRLVGWQQRWLDETEAPTLMEMPKWLGKWTNTTDFPKDCTLYGWDFRLSTEPDLYVVESAKSVLKLRQLGLSALGTFGSNVNEAQLRLLRRFKHLILWPDNDPGGNEWFSTLKNYLKPYARLRAVLPLPDQKADPASYYDGFIREWIADNTVDIDTPHV